MPYGPQNTQPIGTDRQRRIEYFIRVIDSRITHSEGHTLQFGFSVEDHGKYWDIEDEIVQAYKEAGWAFVYWKRYSLHPSRGDELVLSSDPLHVVDTRHDWDTRGKKTFWQMIRGLIGFGD